MMQTKLRCLRLHDSWSQENVACCMQQEPVLPIPSEPATATLTTARGAPALPHERQSPYLSGSTPSASTAHDSQLHQAYQLHQQVYQARGQQDNQQPAQAAAPQALPGSEPISAAHRQYYQMVQVLTCCIRIYARTVYDPV